MRKLKIALAAGTLCLGTVALGFADDHMKGGAEDAHAQGEAAMPPMGPPEEMKQLETMNGEYAVEFFFKMNPMDEQWVETEATAVLSTVAGGGAQQLQFEGNMMGMPFSGVGLTSFDRETQKWQTTWVDSMGARISMYTGALEEGKIVVMGKDMAQGNTFHSRLTTYNMTETGFDWKYEMSMDGTNYMEGAKATYTRK